MLGKADEVEILCRFFFFILIDPMMRYTVGTAVADYVHSN